MTMDQDRLVADLTVAARYAPLVPGIGAELAAALTGAADLLTMDPDLLPQIDRAATTLGPLLKPLAARLPAVLMDLPSLASALPTLLADLQALAEVGPAPVESAAMAHVGVSRPGGR